MLVMCGRFARGRRATTSPPIIPRPRSAFLAPMRTYFSAESSRRVREVKAEQLVVQADRIKGSKSIKLAGEVFTCLAPVKEENPQFPGGIEIFCMFNKEGK